MTTTIETRLGDRLDLLAGVYLLDPMKWEQITALNPGLNLTSGLYLEPGLFIEIPALMPEKIPDLLPWNNQEELQLFEPVEVPPDVQPDAAPDEILSGSGWLTPAQTKALLQIPNYSFPLSIEEGGTSATTAQGARDSIGAASLANISTLTAGLALKADASAVSAALAFKADSISVSDALALKLDTSVYNSEIALKLNISVYNAGIALKLDTSVYNAGIALKLDTSVYNAGIALKLDAAARNAANGVAPLGADSIVPSVNLPAPPTLAGLGGVSTSTYDAGLATKINTTARNAASGVAGLDVNGLLAIGQFPLTNFFGFTGGASFRGVPTPAIPAISTTLVQASVDANGQPRYWLVNASATAGNRLKSITVESNGNIAFGHHADDGTAGIQVLLTPSGNLLTVGTVRPGSGNTAFTGAQFVPGSTYFRTDLSSPNGTGSLTYSNGTEWVRTSNGSPATAPDPGIPKILRGTTAAAQDATAVVAHGLNSAKIVNVTGLVEYSPGLFISIYTRQPNYGTWLSVDGTNINLYNQSANSAAILSKPFSLIVEYVA